MSSSAIFSLYDMLKFNAALFFTTCIELEITLAKFLLEQAHQADDGESFRHKVLEAIQQLKIECNRVGLKASVDQITRLERWLKNSQVASVQIITLLGDLRGNIQQELIERKAFMLQPTENQYWNSSFIPPIIKEKFPSTVNDLSESGKCLIFERPTASVFHSLRALEVCLQCLVKDLQVNITNSNWENVINDCQAAIKNLHHKTPRSQTWKEDQQFYSECATEFRYFKDAWRNYVMHARSDYGPGQALDILESVQRFIIHLSDRLEE